MFGVLAPPRSVFINEKAFRLCHPPRLTGTNGAGWEKIVDEDGYELGDKTDRAGTRRKSQRRNSELPEPHVANAATARSRSYSVAEPNSGPHPQPWNMTTAQVFAPLSASNRLNSSVQMLNHNPATDERIPAAQASSSSRNRSGSGSALTRMLRFGSSSSSNNAGPSSQPPMEPLSRTNTNGTNPSGSRSRNWLRRIGSRDSQEGRSSDDQQRNNQGGLEEVPEDALRGDILHDLPLTAVTTVANDMNGLGLSDARERSAESRSKGSHIDSLPYSIMSHPCPAPSHALYPNYTPRDQVAEESNETYPLDPIFASHEQGGGDAEIHRTTSGHGVDTRQFHPILRERRWLQGVVKDGGRVVPSEWVQDRASGEGEALTWVGPVL